MRVLKVSEGAPVDELAISPDGSAVAAYVSYHGVYLWNLESPSPSAVRVDPAETAWKGGLTFSADGRSLAWLVEGARRTYHRDDRQTVTEKTFAANRSMHAFVQTVDGVQGISSHGVPDHLLVGWQHFEGAWVQKWAVSTADLQVLSPTFSADGRFFAILTRPTLDKYWAEGPFRLEVRDAATKALLGSGEYPYKVEAQQLLFSPDDRQLVGCNAMNLLIWQIPEAGDLGPPRLVRNTTRKNFTGMAYHPTGNYLYVTSNGEGKRDATVHVFNTRSWERAEQFVWQLGNLKAVAVSPDGTLAAAGGDRGDIVIWDVDL